jgi:hypothetical protein
MGDYLKNNEKYRLVVPVLKSEEEELSSHCET